MIVFYYNCKSFKWKNKHGLSVIKNILLNTDAQDIIQAEFKNLGKLHTFR